MQLKNFADLLRDPLTASEYLLPQDDPGRNRVLAAYQDLLRAVRIPCPGILLTGGAVRDTYYGRTVKDLDFISQNRDDVYHLGTWIGEKLRPCIDPEMLKEYAPHSGSMLLAYETADKGTNLLYVFSVYGRITEFPDSISQCWTDGEEVYGTEAFKTTADVRRVEMSHTISPEREQRLRTKYPDFSFEYEI